MGAGSRKPSIWMQDLMLVGKDFTREFRTREMLMSMGLYAVLVIIVYGAALALVARDIDILSMSGGLIWVLIVFTSILGLNRSFSYEREQSCIEGLLLAPVDRSVIFLAKATTNFLFMMAVEIIVIPMFYFFFMTGVELSASLGWIVAPLFFGTLGMAGVGTMLSTITAGTRSKDVMLAVLLIPLIYPLLQACVTATTAAITGAELWTDCFVVPLALAGGYDVIMLAVCWTLYDFVVSA